MTRMFDKLLAWELRSLENKSKNFNLAASATLSTIFLLLSLNLENKTPACFMAGFLLFWERYVLISLHSLKNDRNHKNTPINSQSAKDDQP